jgi:hypothetical protein
MTDSWLARRSEGQRTAILVAIATLGFGYMGFLCWLAFVNWKAAIFLLLLALVTNQVRE